MRRYLSILLIVLVAVAAFPGKLRYRGMLTDAAGTALSGDHGITFRIYDVPTGGTPLWTETQTVALTAGGFDIALGELSPVDLSFDGSVYVEMEIGGETLAPREEILPTAFAHRARNAVTVDSAVVSVSSSANHTGRVGHIRFVAWEDAEITESAESSATDTIYIAVGGSSGTTPGSSELIDAKPFIKASEGSQVGATWGNLFTITPITPGNYITPSHMKIEARSSYSYSYAYIRYTITYADASTYTSGELSVYGSAWTTVLETTIPFHSGYRGTITSIAIDGRNSSASYSAYGRMELSGYEVEP